MRSPSPCEKMLGHVMDRLAGINVLGDLRSGWQRLGEPCSAQVAAWDLAKVGQAFLEQLRPTSLLSHLAESSILKRMRSSASICSWAVSPGPAAVAACLPSWPLASSAPLFRP